MPERHPVASKMRECLGGGGSHPEADLLKLVADPQGQVYVDLTAKLKGPAAYVVPQAANIRRAAAELPSVLGIADAPQAEALLEMIRSQLQKRFLGSLGLARKSGGVATGTDKVCDGLQNGDVKAVLLANDTAAHTAERVNRTAKGAGIQVFSVVDRQALSTALGQTNCAVAALLDRPQAMPALAGVLRLQALIRDE